MSDLQRIVDGLSLRTGRPVAVHDRTGNILAYSAHDEVTDPVRIRSILSRKASGPAFAWSKSLGIEKASAPMRVPANAEFGMESRVCAPVRFQEKLLGLLWLVDPDETLDMQSEIAGAADSAALAIHHEQLMDEVKTSRERELVRDLLSDQVSVRQEAAEELIESGSLESSETIVALVIRPFESSRQAIEDALHKTRSGVRAGSVLTLARPGHGLLISTARPGEAVEKLGLALHQSMPDKSVVGIGDTQVGLSALMESYRHAKQAADVATLVESFAPVAGWWELGVYQTLLDLPVENLTRSSLHRGLVKLMDVRGADVWLKTLEKYLDLACDARATAQALSVQRGSLYYRLHRIEALAGVDLNNGDDRLSLHLGLKLARLAGLMP